PQLLRPLIVERHHRARDERGDDQAPAGRQRAGGVGIGYRLALLELAGRRIDDRDAAGEAAVIAKVAAIEAALHVASLVARDVGAAFELGDVHELGALAVGRRPDMLAARHARA